jgi:hypothetical protein
VVAPAVAVVRVAPTDGEAPVGIPADAEAHSDVPATAVVTTATATDVSLADPVLRQVVVKAGTARHLPRERGEFGLRIEIFVEAPSVEETIVPVIVTDEGRGVERISGERGIHRPQTLRLIDAERLAVAPTEQLEVLTAANEIVVKWIEGQEHADAAVGLCVQDEQVSVLLSTSIHANTIAPLEIPSFAQPDFHRSVLLNNDRRFGRRDGKRR